MCHAEVKILCPIVTPHVTLAGSRATQEFGVVPESPVREAGRRGSGDVTSGLVLKPC